MAHSGTSTVPAPRAPSEIRIRPAGAEDQQAIRAIYNGAVATSTATFTAQERSDAEQARWFAERVRAGWPVLVAAVDGVVAGFATYGSFRTSPGYRHTVEHSVYVDEAFRRHGVGAALLDALVGLATAAGHHVMVGALDADNEPSLQLHRKLGFSLCGRIPQVGWKFGRWLDLALVARVLDSPAGTGT